MGPRLMLGWAVLASVASVILERVSGTATLNAASPDDWGLAVLLLALAVAGLVLVEGRRAVKAGVLLLLMGAGTSTAFLAHAVVVAALIRGEDGPAVQVLVWLATWLFVPSIGVLPFVPALWPDNRIASPWLRRPTMVAVIALGMLTVGQALAPDHLDGVGPGLPAVPNPAGVAPLAAVVGVATAVCSAVMVAYTGAVLIDVIVRYSRGDHALRVQLRPLVLVLTGLPFAAAAGAALAGLGGGQIAIGQLAAVGVLLLGGLAVSLIRTERAVQRGERAVAQRRRTVETAEDERRKLRRDLHDGLGPGLAAVRLQLDAVRRVLPPTADEAARRLVRVEATLAAALEELRCIIGGLRPAALDELGLSGALTSQGRAVTIPERCAPVIDVIIDPTVPPLPDAVEVAIVRVSGEALSNAIRHGHPTRCTVSLGWQDGHAVLRVEDDGTGMTSGTLGHGMTTMRQRVEELGGKLIVSSASPRGTVISAQIPAAR